MLNLSSSTVEKADGSFQRLDEFTGLVLLIVNVASSCTYTLQYHALRQLDLLYGPRGLRILAFPCNDFGNQEPLGIEAIQNYVDNAFRLPFKLYAKVNILVDKSAPFDILTASLADEIKWNFEKFLVDKHGNVVAHFDTSIEPHHPDLVGTIENLLRQ
jgi:glutathione peroxidase